MVQLPNYASTHPEEITRYHDSGMILHMHSDRSFLSATGANSRLGGYHYLSKPLENPNPPLQQNTTTQRPHPHVMNHN